KERNKKLETSVMFPVFYACQSALQRKTGCYARVAVAIDRIQQPKNVVVVKVIVAAQVQKRPPQRLAIEKLFEKSDHPIGCQERGHWAFRADQTARALVYKVRHEPVVKQRREFR